MGKVVLYWFRTDLRLHDSPALAHALALRPTHFYPVWTWDPHYVVNQKVGSNRWQFLLDSMKNLNKNIKAINPASQLFVVRGPPSTILPALFQAWKITDIVWEKDDDPYTFARDAEITKLAESAGVTVHTKLGHTLWDAEDIIKASKGSKLTTSYGGFQKLVGSLPAPPKPLDAPRELPSPGITDIPAWSREEHSIQPYLERGDTNAPIRDGEERSFASFTGPQGGYEVPTIEELGVQAPTSRHRGGEDLALEIMDKYLEDKKRVIDFHKPQTSPAAWPEAATTTLSPHMKFGTLSVRRFYYALKAIEEEALSQGKRHSAPPESLVGQLLWREFFHAQQAATPNFQRIRGNPTSRYIAWDLQTPADSDTMTPEQIEQGFKDNEPEAWERFVKWREGRTGFPWIDACMRQLRREGWLHHLARHSVACFLTRGHLYISWERGAEVFDTDLVDWDPALNSGNWMWLSASAFFHQYFRVYSPITYGQKFDKSGALIREFVPELKGFPDKYIYEPWKASLQEQEKAGCIIGKDYPQMMVDEKAAKQACLSKMKAAYDAGLHGDDDAVLEGRADSIIRENEDTKPPPPKPTQGKKRDRESKDGLKQAKLEFGAPATKKSKK